MAENQETAKALPHSRWEGAYKVIAALFGALMVLGLAYGLLAAFQYSDSGDAQDLARLLTSGFLFLISGVAVAGMCLRLTSLNDTRWLIGEVRRMIDSSGE